MSPLNSEPTTPSCSPLGAACAWARTLFPGDDPAAATHVRVYRIAFWGVLLIAAGIRLWRVIHWGDAPLDPDAQGFLEIIRGGAWYETASSIPPWVREPFWIWVNRPAAWVFGANPATLRAMSALVGVAVVWVAWRLAGTWFGPAVALVTATGLALSPRWYFWGGRGLRTELQTLLVLLFLLEWTKQHATCATTRLSARANGAGVVTVRWWQSLRPAVRLAALGSAAQLTYISSLSFTFPFVFLRGVLSRWRPAAWILSAAILILPLLPHLGFNYRFQDSRDPLFSSNIHARFYHNYEFLALRDDAGRAQFNADPYAGPPISTGHYLLREHTPAQLLAGMARGAFNVFLHRMPYIEQFATSKVVGAIYLLGIVISLLLPAGRAAAAATLWLSLPTLYLASLRGFDTRILAPLTPWMWMMVGIGSVALARTLARYAGGFSARPRSS